MTEPIHSPSSTRPEHRPHVIPWWLAVLIALPLRRWWEKPEEVVGPLVHAGETVLEVGPGAGFFSSALAAAVGERGKLVCVDLEPRLLRHVERRVAAHGMRDRLETRSCTAEDLGISDLVERADVVIAINVIHEMPWPARAVTAMAKTLKSGGRLLILEPRGHCSEELFRNQLDAAAQAGLSREPDPPHLRRGGYQALFRKP
jgi:ubiquinone/menaquinone biosynthesis C-methylase UbiE